jgi:hypothetical protein
LVLHLLVDTSVWLDLAKKRDGQKLIHVIGQVMQDGDLELLVPGVVVDEFERNRERIEQSMTTGVAARFKGLRKDLEDLSAESHRPAFGAIAGLAHEMPLIGRQMNATNEAQTRLVSRALQKRAPFHLNKNSVTDALLAELYAESHGEGAIRLRHVEPRKLLRPAGRPP